MFNMDNTYQDGSLLANELASNPNGELRPDSFQRPRSHELGRSWARPYMVVTFPGTG